MGKKAKSKEKKKNAIFKSKYVPAKKKGMKDKDKPEAKQKGSKKQAKALEKEYRTLATKYQGVEGQAASMLEQISRLQIESREIKDSLALEAENTVYVRDRIDSLETGKEIDQQTLKVLRQQAEQQAGLVTEAGSRLEAVERLTSQSASLREQIEYLQAGKSEMESSIGKLAKEGNALKSDSHGLVSRVEDLSMSFDEVIQRKEKNAGRHQVIEAWMDNLSRADSDLSLQMGQQQERIQGLVEKSGKLDQAAHEITESYRALQEEVRSLSRSLMKAQEQLAGKDAELEKKSRFLESQYQRLTVKHDRFAGIVLVGGLLLLILAGAGYWTQISSLDDRTTTAARQIEQISEQVGQHERKLAHQEQQFFASKEALEDSQAPALGEMDGRFESMSRSYEAMDERLKGVAEQQHEMTAKYVQFGENQVEMGRQLEQTQGLLAELVTREDGRKTGAKEQEHKPRMIEDHSQRAQSRPKVESAQGTAGKVKDSVWLQGLSPRHYTIQIFAAYDAAVVSRIASREDLHETMAIHKGEFNQKDWYILLYGEYSTIREARSAIQDLPEDIRTGGPWVRKLSSIQNDLAE